MKLRDRLKQLGMSQRDFAVHLGVSEATVSSWISGRVLPDVRKFPLIEAVTAGAVTMADFLDTAGAITARPPSTKARPSSAPGFAEARLPFAAAALGLDPEAIAAAALKQAIGAEKARRWAEENAEAIAAHTRYVEEHDTPLAKYRMF